MKGRTHLTIGLGIGAVASVSQTPEMIPIVLAVSAVASLAPDLDGNNLLNKHVTKTAKQIKKGGQFVGVALIVLSLFAYIFNINFLPFLEDEWLTQQNKLLFLGLGAIIIALSMRSQETLKNILMSILGLFLLYYAITDELSWLVMFALYIGAAGWFPHRGQTHTIWAVIYWGYMSYLLEMSTGAEHLAIISTMAYLSHILGDMMTIKGVKFLSPITSKVFKIRI
ncbi:metal-dependent hydrolase [Solibacillus sp. A46]|uniref:Metal-dependent hydrolase n=1 Tax=Solibacillus faecavium TaxID=2762221 RepID=A0ABR8XWH1_9BACL|nr:metal-dependent hydrolase [Solibacillus faecavium]MBD8036292.1 metal-dependent hydrolase [Solibacillus faecavium]